MIVETFGTKIGKTAAIQAGVSLSKPLLTRKDVANLLGLDTVAQVKRNEKRLGLDKARRDINARCVRYSSAVVIAIFKARGFVQ